MDDYISRQTAIDAICKEGTRLERNGTVAMCEIKQWCIDLLERLPSAQPEITRCGECTHKDKKIDYCHYLGITICERDYCSYAKRRTDEQND